jgi:hypothetical protein
MADGEHLTGNVITGILDNGHAMYCDNGCTYWTAEGNVSIGNISNDWGSRHADYMTGQTGDDPLLVSGNYWWEGDADSNIKNTVVNGNHVIAGLADAPASIVNAAGLEPRYRHILNERFGRSAPAAPDQVAAFAVNGSAYVGWNPTIVDNGAPVTGYTVTASPGGQQATLSAADLAKIGYVAVPGLTDGTGYTFTVTAHNAYGTSAPSLPSATVTPNQVTVSAEKFTWPGVAAGQPDNVVATGQTIPASGSGSSLGILATASFGLATGTGQVTYSDGTSQSVTLSVPDWYATPPGGSNIAFTGGYRNRPGNVQQTHQTTVFYLNVPLDPTKTVTGIVLPNIGAVASATPALHVFAMNIGSTPVDLSAAFDNVGVTDDTATAAGNLDGSGSSFSAQALAASGVTPGATVTTQSSAPGAPASVNASPGDGAVSIHFNPPSSTGISPIVGYTITAPGLPPIQVTGHDYLWAGSGNSVYTVVGGLTNGTPYTFTITANNVAGPGKPATVTVTPNPTT